MYIYIIILECTDFNTGQQACNLLGQFGSGNPRVIHFFPCQISCHYFSILILLSTQEPYAAQFQGTTSTPPRIR